MELPKINLKKIPYYLTLGLLTSGASVILGFLSFGGMLALSSVLPLALPALPLAVAAFALSVGYEGEIYLQNIKGALSKLFKHNYMKRRLADEYLLALFTDSNFDTNVADCPEFFKDYAAQCRLLSQFEHKTLDKASAVRKKQAEKTLNDMEKWFARQLITEDENNFLIGDTYQKELQDWLMNPPDKLIAYKQSEWLSRFQARKTKFNLFKIFSSLSALFMGLGTTYLLVEAFGAIPWMLSISAATLPVLIVPMAIIAGLAYGLLTYNAITDMLTNNKVFSMYNKLKANLSRSNWTWHDVAMAATGIGLGALAVLLTICTAGTWWTVAKNTRPLFAWMGKLPSVVMGVINPIITGISALVFNMQNSAESLEIIADSTEPDEHAQPSVLQRLKDAFARLNERENTGQIINPFRLILKLTIAPLRVVLFLGHLVSIGLTADRVPGVPEIVSAILGIVSEGFEDLHYFVGHDHDSSDCCGHHHDGPLQSFIKNRLSPAHGHNHDADLPTKALLLMFSPIYALAAAWDWAASQIGSNPITFERAWNKQHGVAPKQKEMSIDLNQQPIPSAKWQVEHAVYRIERHKEKELSDVLIGRGLADEKRKALTVLQDKLRESVNTADFDSVKKCIDEECPDLYNQHRFFGSAGRGETSTSQFLHELPARVCP